MSVQVVRDILDSNVKLVMGFYESVAVRASLENCPQQYEQLDSMAEEAEEAEEDQGHQAEEDQAEEDLSPLTQHLSYSVADHLCARLSLTSRLNRLPECSA